MFRNFFYNLIFGNYFLLNRLGLFDRIWKWLAFPQFDVRTKLFGSSVIIPSGYTYPITARVYRSFNNPYLELVYCCYKKKHGKLNIIDAGASIGDTFLFIYKNIPEAVDKIFCAEGHTSFLKYLELNTKRYPTSVILPVILSDKKEVIKELVHIHESTASAQGTSFVNAKPLDTAISSITNEIIDILKIDADGFDGRILAGAKNILSLSRPHVIFEYHPGLISDTGNDLLQPFAVLEECGYKELLWFDKFGVYSHQSNTEDKSALKEYADACLRQNRENDHHYDIIALPIKSSLNVTNLVECQFAKNKKFSY